MKINIVALYVCMDICITAAAKQNLTRDDEFLASIVPAGALREEIAENATTPCEGAKKIIKKKN